MMTHDMSVEKEHMKNMAQFTRRRVSRIDCPDSPRLGSRSLDEVVRPSVKQGHLVARKYLVPQYLIFILIAAPLVLMLLCLSGEYYVVTHPEQVNNLRKMGKAASTNLRSGNYWGQRHDHVLQLINRRHRRQRNLTAQPQRRGKRKVEHTNKVKAANTQTHNSNNHGAVQPHKHKQKMKAKQMDKQKQKHPIHLTEHISKVQKHHSKGRRKRRSLHGPRKRKSKSSKLS